MKSKVLAETVAMVAAAKNFIVKVKLKIIYKLMTPFPYKKDKKWACLPGFYREVDLKKIMGATFLHKLETVLACLNQIPNL